MAGSRYLNEACYPKPYLANMEGMLLLHDMRNKKKPQNWHQVVTRRNVHAQRIDGMPIKPGGLALVIHGLGASKKGS